jgi:hypothetical protein
MLRALYESHRQQILLHAKDINGDWNFPPAYLYAVSRRISPIFHSWHGGDEDPFEDLYAANTEFLTSVATWMDEQELAKRKITFYDLEQHIGHEHRGALIACVRYCALDNRFNPAFYSTLLRNEDCPIEALRAADPFGDEAPSIL